MRRLNFVAAGIVAGLLSACTATPPKSEQVSNNPLLTREGGVLLMVDVCVQRDELGEGDYFVIAESEAGSQAALETLHQYLGDDEIQVRAVATAVCAARLNADRSPISVADTVDGKKRQAAQPLHASGAHTDDAQYVQALATMSTYAFEHAAVQDKKEADEEHANKPEAAAAIGMDEFRAAGRVIQQKTGASSVLFLGALGVSRSAGKAVAQKLGSIAVGFGTAFATAGLGTGYYFWFMPGYQTDGVQMEGALIDLQSGELTWSNAVRVGGDPVRPEVIANPAAFDVLFRDVMFKPVASPSAVSSNE